jgi:hypothetical protein
MVGCEQLGIPHYPYVIVWGGGGLEPNHEASPTAEGLEQLLGRVSAEKAAASHAHEDL